MDRLEFNKVGYFFKEISKIPRKSGEERKIADYLVGFAKQRNLEWERDAINNVIIRRKAFKGYENKRIALQAHTDMICEKLPECKHDFSKDGIEIYEEGDFWKAKGTTLGADNGIGVAFILAILDSNWEIPEIEGIFTVEEETTMKGAIEIDLDRIKSNKIISLDNGKEGKILVSSANCNEWGIKYVGEKEEIKDGDCYELVYSNFKGGHSGGNIGDSKRGNPIKLAVEALKKQEIQIVEMNGGSRVNVIPRDMKIKFSMKGETNAIKRVIKEQIKFYGDEVDIILRKIEKEKIGYTKQTSKKILDFIWQYKNGVLEKDETENVVLSANLGVIRTEGKQILLEISERSNEKELEQRYLEDLKRQIKEYQWEIDWHQELKGVEKKDKNELVKICKKVYEETTGKAMEEVISQGVVEGGFFLAKKKEAEYVCIGANTFDVHSPAERVSISSVERTWEYLKNLLQEMKKI